MRKFSLVLATLLSVCVSSDAVFARTGLLAHFRSFDSGNNVEQVNHVEHVTHGDGWIVDEHHLAHDAVVYGAGPKGKGKDHYYGLGLIADFELLYMEVSKSHGVGPAGAPNDIGYEPTVRATFGVINEEGTGLRFRYWEYSATGGPIANLSLVDTYNLDLEYFQRLDLGCLTRVEWSVGLRYNDYIGREDGIGAGIRDSFAGFGLTFGGQVNRVLGCGNTYARAKWAVLKDDDSHTFGGMRINDRVNMQSELGAGYEVSRCTGYGTITARVGYEFQYWENYGPDAPAGDFGNIAFDGFVGGLAWEY